MQSGITETDIRSYLDELKIAHADLGFGYLITAIQTLLSGRIKRAGFKAQDVYQVVAKEHHASEACIERAIRAAIRKGSKRDGHPNWHRTNKEFIACAVDALSGKDGGG